MPNCDTSNDRHAGGRNRARLILVWLALVAIASGGAAAAGAPTVLSLKSGLQTLYARHAFVVTLTDVGPPEAASWVTVEFLDRAGQRRAFASERLSPDRSVRLKVTTSAAVASEQFRVAIVIEPIPGAALSQPVAGLEDLDANAFRVDTKPPCAPPSVGAGAEGNCDGWVVTRLTLGQAPASH